MPPIPPEKDFLEFLQTLPWIILLAIAGGLANFIMRLNQAREPQPLRTIFLKLLGELFLSGFAGLVTFLLCREWGFSPNYTAVMVAISGHMGGQAITHISKLYNAVMRSKLE